MGFRLEKEEYINKTFRLPEELVRNCQEEASKRGVSLNYYVIQALQYSLDSLEPIEKKAE